MLGEQVLQHGYPKVHGPRHVVYDLSLPIEDGVREPLDAFIVSPWLQFYWGALGAWLADGSGDPVSMTARLRLPFAVAGAAGALLPLALVWSLAGGCRTRRLRAAAFQLAMLATSISLLLHLREARWIPLATLELGALAWMRAARIRGRIDPKWATLAETGLLVLLVHTFLPAFASASAALLLDAWLGWRGESLRERFRSALPVVVAGLFAVPALWFYETFSVSHAFAERTGAGIGGMLGNLRHATEYLLRYEVLAPALLAAALRVAWQADRSVTQAAARVTRFLWILVACHILVIAAIPWFFARYAVILAPLLIALLTLELLAIETHLAATPRVRRRFAIGCAAALAAIVVLRAPEIGGRLAELRDPPRGPLDFAIEDLRARHPDPRELLIATNYEALVFAFYLDSAVLDTQRLDGGSAPAGVIADVIVPRRHWDANRNALRDLLGRAAYDVVALPVADRPMNTTPELGPANPPSRYRSFVDPAPAAERDRLQIYERVLP